jgi:DNA-binding YbaB/EbfC family protein
MNPMDLLKNFQNIQSKVGEMQEKLQGLKVTGTAGGDMVKVEMNGQMTVTRVTISPEAVDPEDLGMLEDLVLAAITDASVKIKETIRQEMSGLTGGIDLPPGILGT